MRLCLEETIKQFNEWMIESSAPARADLFFIDKAKSRVEEQMKKLFHHLVCRLTWCKCRGRTDLQDAMSFIPKRNLGCNKHDYCKLRSLVNFMHGVLDLEAFIGTEDTGKLVTFVNSSFALHMKMRSHAGGSVTFGTCDFSSMSLHEAFVRKSI